MENSIVHRREVEENNLARHLFPDGSVPWDEPIAPDLESGDERRLSGRIRMCSYCGSMHPTDVAAAIKAGAQGAWADLKYGWPHKAYFTGVPNPHFGLLESRHTATYQHRDDWVQVGDRIWRAPGEPAAATLMWKFYTVHLRDATPEEKELIENHLGVHFEFTEDGRVTTSKVR